MKKKISIQIVLILLAIVGLIVFSAYTSSEAYRKKKANESVNNEQITSISSSEQEVQTEEFTDIVENDNSSETEDCECAIEELPRLVVINDELYYDTAEESTSEHSCGTMDGTIETSQSGSKGIPTENNASNFGIGYGWQYGTEDTIEVYIDDRWCVFRKYEKGLIEVLDKALEN